MVGLISTVGLTPIGISMSRRWWIASAGLLGPSRSGPTSRGIAGWSTGSKRRVVWFGSGWRDAAATALAWLGI